MKKYILTALTVAILTLNPQTTFAEETANIDTNIKIAHGGPGMCRMYDKDGNVLKQFPKPGDVVYDKNGNKVKIPEGPKLNLTDAQKEQMDNIRKESRTKIKPIKKEIHNYYNQVWEIKEDDSLTKEQKFAKMQPIFENIRTLEKRANEIRKSDMEQFEKLLTPKQKAEFEKFKKAHKHHRDIKKHKLPDIQ